MSILTDPRPPDEDGRERTLLVLLQRVWTYAFTTKSDTSRDYADEIAEGASRGFLTTQVVPTKDVYGRLWKVTPKGLAYLYQEGGLIAEDEVSNYVDSFTGGQ